MISERTAAGLQQNGTAAGLAVTDTQATASPQANVPLLRVFSPDGRMTEFIIDKDAITIGRMPDCDLCLANRAVSRLHATITRHDGQFKLTDARSTFGTSVNGERITEQTLKSGDTIRIGTYVLQFCDRRQTPGAGLVAQRARLLLRGEYSTSPPPGLKYRSLTIDATSPFDTSTTQKIGQHGLLIPASSPPGDNVHLEIVVPLTPRETRRFLGVIVGVVEQHGTQWMCVDLHSLPPWELDLLVASCKPGPWIDFRPS